MLLVSCTDQLSLYVLLVIQELPCVVLQVVPGFEDEILLQTSFAYLFPQRRPVILLEKLSSISVKMLAIK